jgi:hypothetical protein
MCGVELAAIKKAIESMFEDAENEKESPVEYTSSENKASSVKLYYIGINKYS